jgi:hypothetical protein
VDAVAYQNPGVSTWRELLNRMSQYKPEFFKGALLVAIGVGAFGFSVLAFAVFAVAPGGDRPAYEGDDRASRDS